MGRKTGYAGAILRVMGLRPHQRAERYLWAEADGDVAALLAAYTQPEKMREIAEIIRSWIPCPYGPHEMDPSCSRCKGTGRWDARDLWEVLRRERRAGLWEGGADVDSVARGALLGSWSYRQSDEDSGGFVGPGDRRQDTSALALDRAAMPWPPVLIAQDAAVDVGGVAGWLYLSGKAYDSAKFARSGAAAGGFWFGEEGGTGRERYPLGSIAENCGALPWPPVHLTPAADLPVPPLPSGTVVYMDPPYLNTTGYKHALDRAAVIEIARSWHHAGARVYISEAEPIAALGWHHVEITSERKGQARTFGATPEWLTCSHRPAWTPPQQSTLFTRLT
jgi:hypothetical protein